MERDHILEYDVSPSRLIISTFWLAIGGLVGLSLYTDYFQLPISVWGLGLLLVALLFGSVVNWWSETSGFLYFVLVWGVGGVIVWLWGLIQVPLVRYLVGHGITDWNWFCWFWPALLLALLGLMLSKLYLRLEYTFNPEEFADSTTTRDCWYPRNAADFWSADFPVLVIGFFGFGGWFLPLFRLDYAIDVRTLERAVYALLFVWLAVWMSKLHSTLRAKRDKTRALQQGYKSPEDPPLFEERYLRAVARNVPWNTIRDDKSQVKL